MKSFLSESIVQHLVKKTYYPIWKSCYFEISDTV